MVNFLIADQVTNTTNTTIAYRVGPFGLQEFEYTLSLPISNGKSWIISTWTSDAVVLIFTILVFTFAVDHYLFNSRYLVHIGGTKRVEDRNNSNEEKAVLHEKEALNIESGQKFSNNEKHALTESKTKRDSDSSSSTTYGRWRNRAFTTVRVLTLLALSLYNSETPDRSPEKVEEFLSTPRTQVDVKKEDLNKPLQTGRWSKLLRHPLTDKILGIVGAISILLFVLSSFAFHILFWPLFISLSTMVESSLSQEAHLDVSAHFVWLKFIFYLAIWTIIGVTLLSKPSRFQSTLWKCLRWTHAINWWLCFGIVYFLTAMAYLHEHIGYRIEIHELVFFALRPALVAYIYAGVVLDAIVKVRLCKYLWHNDITKC